MTFTGMNLREALRIALQLGATIYAPRRTGELVITHPLIPERVRINGRRKDAPRCLSGFLSKLTRLTAHALPAA